MSRTNPFKLLWVTEANVLPPSPNRVSASARHRIVPGDGARSVIHANAIPERVSAGSGRNRVVIDERLNPVVTRALGWDKPTAELQAVTPRLAPRLRI